MHASTLEPPIAEELKRAYSQGVSSETLMSQEQIDQNLRTFRDNFGPTVLGGVDGATLLRLMHERESGKPKCLAYWLEFKNDEEFAGTRFGSIAGGSALKFGIYQRQSDGAWVSGSSKAQVILSPEEAMELARKQRDELLAGCDVLTSVNVTDTSDAVYAQLQTDMEKAAPTLCHLSWSHKYWSLLFSDRLDDYHSPVYQRFHLLKLVQMPPEKLGILDAGAPRFNCAGRFISLARELGIPVTTLDKLLNLRDGSMHGYWKVGTVGSTGEGSFWEAMRDGGFVAIAWKVPELTAVLAEEKQTAKKQIADWVLPLLSTPKDPAQKAVASRKAGEILNFARTMEENDIVLACQGQTVLGVGRISGAYRYDEGVDCSHQRPVNWVMLEPWQLPVAEAPRTTTGERLVILPVTGESFVIPMNVCIIGTMNTADRSISLIDIALRRRFGFVELMPESTLLAATTVGGLQLGSWLDALNLRLRKHLKRDARNLQVGHAYLMPKKPITSVADFSRVLRDEIIPLLEEYCYDDFATLRDILGAELVDAEAGRIRDDIFAANRDDDLIGAVLFEELPSIMLSKAESLEVPTDEDADDEEPEDGNPDDDDVSAT
jgi:hypothetical protein